MNQPTFIQPNTDNAVEQVQEVRVTPETVTVNTEAAPTLSANELDTYINTVFEPAVSSDTSDVPNTGSVGN